VVELGRIVPRSLKSMMRQWWVTAICPVRIASSRQGILIQVMPLASFFSFTRCCTSTGQMGCFK
jgi:hypothetical protein